MCNIAYLLNKEKDSGCMKASPIKAAVIRFKMFSF